MYRIIGFFACVFLFYQVACAQANHGFPFGEVTLAELAMKKYDRDTSAEVLYLNEFGEAYISDTDDMNLVFEYHAKIKVLTTGGLDVANISIPLHKFFGKEELLRSFQASTFSLIDGVRKETALNTKNTFTENNSKNITVKKFTLPNVQVGSVIEFSYILESPYIFNFRSWEFQSEYPKKRSEFWATIPGNYIYNISLRGFLKFTSDESEVMRDCFRPAGRSADCARHKFVMENVPAFIEEDYMTVSSNFISAINFELSEIHYFDGRVDKITKEWKDVANELRYDERFGLQIKRGKDVVDEKIEQLMIGETSPLEKARKIYDFTKSWYRWNEVTSKYSEFGIKKAFAERKGNVGDINLSLIAALKYAGLNVEPLILSTRENGIPVDVHPVLSEFNYVIAKLNIDDKVYLLDATDRFSPFGVLPMRCLNGKGRVLNDKESYWYEIKPTEKKKRVTAMELTLNADGEFQGSIQNVYSGYEAIQKRQEINQLVTLDEYQKKERDKLKDIEVTNFQLENVDDLDKSLIEKLTVKFTGFDASNAQSFFFNPFFIERWDKNPFRSAERLYPVDFGMPMEEVIIINITVPPDFESVDLPETVRLALPNGGGRYLYGVERMGNKIKLSHSLFIARAVYSSDEYHYLKELFNRIIQYQNIDLIFKKTKQ